MSEVSAPVIATVAVAVVVPGVAYLWRLRERHNAFVTRLRLDGIEGLVLFFTDAACKRCDLVRQRLESLGASFIEIAYNREPDLHRTIGVTGVPLLVVRDDTGAVLERVAGLASERRIRRALARLA